MHIVVAVVTWLISGSVVLPSASAQSVAAGQASQLSTQDVPGAAMQSDDVQILSNTLGVNFGPYIKGILPLILKQYVKFLPQEVRSPTFASGITGVRFTINPDGKLAPGRMRLDYSTHDQALDRAAWGAITSQERFPPLPASFTGPNLEIRVEFRVNLPKR